MDSWHDIPSAVREVEELPDGKVLERIYGVTKRCKLFVSPLKVSIRYKIGITEEEKARIDSFFLKVAPLVKCEKTVRGHLGRHKTTDTLYIVLMDESKTFSKRVAETEV